MRVRESEGSLLWWIFWLDYVLMDHVKIRKALWFRKILTQILYHVLWSYILQARPDWLATDFLFGLRLQWWFFDDFNGAHLHVFLYRQAGGRTSTPGVKFAPLKWSQWLGFLTVPTQAAVWFVQCHNDVFRATSSYSPHWNSPLDHWNLWPNTNNHYGIESWMETADLADPALLIPHGVRFEKS